MNAAASLLGDSDLSLKEIAFNCGYANPAHFTAAFQKYFTQTPTEYLTRIYAANLI